jgi:hypothetical protein
VREIADARGRVILSNGTNALIIQIMRKRNDGPGRKSGRRKIKNKNARTILRKVKSILSDSCSVAYQRVLEIFA